ncbi:MAG: response regulator transcription factor [Spirochaetales bacterium]
MGYRILVIDDSILVRSGLQRALSSNSAFDELLIAEDGQKGLELLKAEKPDLVCTDVEMPNMTGLELLEAIGEMKERGELPEAFPVVVLSGTMHENEPNVRKARMLGAADVIAKPEGKASTTTINTKELEKRLLNLLL